MPPGTYTPLETDVSADGVTTADEDEAIKRDIKKGLLNAWKKGGFTPLEN